MASNGDWLADEEGNLNPEIARQIAPAGDSDAERSMEPNPPGVGGILAALGRGLLLALATVVEEHTRSQERRQARPQPRRRRTRRARRNLLLGLLFVLLTGLFVQSMLNGKGQRQSRGRFSAPQAAAG